METEKTLTVTSPLLPPLEEFVPYLEDIWLRKWLTNNGHYHQELPFICRRVSSLNASTRRHGHQIVRP